MAGKFTLGLLAVSLSGCVTAPTDQASNATDGLTSSPTDPSRLVVSTATVDGRAYDVVYDRYAPETASIYGARVMDGSFLPQAEIIESATPCRQSSLAFTATGLDHPTRDDLELLTSLGIDCTE